MEKDVTIWFDEEGDYLEVIFERKKGYFKETENDAIMEKVDEQGKYYWFFCVEGECFKRKTTFIGYP